MHNIIIHKITTCLAIVLVALVSVSATRAAEPSANEIMQRSNLARYYPGDDMRARVVMRLISSDGRERIRDMILTRRNIESGGEQRYFIFFTRPPDVRDMSFLVHRFPDRDDDRWLYLPAVKAVRRIAASDKNTSFVGSDFTYEDVSGRDPIDDTHALIREEKFMQRDTFVVKSVPRNPANADFSRKESWVDKATWLPLKEEFYDRRGDLSRVFTAPEMKQIEGFWTATKRVMKNAQSGHKTEVELSEVRYNRKLSADLFTERSLRTPPADLTR